MPVQSSCISNFSMKVRNKNVVVHVIQRISCSFSILLMNRYCNCYGLFCTKMRRVSKVFMIDIYEECLKRYGCVNKWPPTLNQWRGSLTVVAGLTTIWTGLISDAVWPAAFPHGQSDVIFTWLREGMLCSKSVLAITILSRKLKISSPFCDIWAAYNRIWTLFSGESYHL